MPKIKILISHHEKRSIIKTSILTPIQTGCALAQERFEEMLQDDDGENISDKNPKYCEFTAIYWAWKNYDKLGNPDYIGFMHNRRHLLFNQSLPVPDKQMTWLEPHGAVYLFPPICPKYMSYIEDKAIWPYFPKYDVLTIKPQEFVPTKYDTVYHGPIMKTRYLNTAGTEESFFDIFEKTVRKYAPDYQKELDDFLSGNIMYLCNIFVMRKDLFIKYCKFIFPLLEKIDSQIASDNFSPMKKRFLGYLGEYLSTLFFLHLRNKIKMKELNASFIMEKNKKDYIKLCRYAMMGLFNSSYAKKYYFLRKKLNIFKWGIEND
ncbi:MAG: DUF4422 domain-containing protein [Spirochaetia bacterium]|uniref:DUF4422 domain-containing protein n=1 Tax=Candidatus Avelusimicrobium fimicolum TaxID=3416216 RepID=UPI003C9F1AE9|nr:DUF4422 domain-containing protein [Spirochaetia bacterium]